MKQSTYLRPPRLLILTLSMLLLTLFGCSFGPRAASGSRSEGGSLPPDEMPFIVRTRVPTAGLWEELALTTVPSEDSGWHPAGAGIEWRNFPIKRSGAPVAAIHIVRLNTANVRFVVGYNPKSPQSLEAWRSKYHAVAAINGGFFEVDNTSTALTIHEGSASGESYVGRGGMFGVQRDGSIVLRSLRDEPYEESESLVEAMQGWPMLVKPGGVAAYTDDGDTTRAPRSVVARDQQGRILFIVCNTPAFSLHELSAWLPMSDLDIDTALNLDGGSSSGLRLDSNGQRIAIDPLVQLPIVLLAVPRE